MNRTEPPNEGAHGRPPVHKRTGHVQDMKIAFMRDSSWCSFFSPSPVWLGRVARNPTSSGDAPWSGHDSCVVNYFSSNHLTSRTLTRYEHLAFSL